jgi:hypothetical protein
MNNIVLDCYARQQEDRVSVFRRKVRPSLFKIRGTMEVDFFAVTIFLVCSGNPVGEALRF